MKPLRLLSILICLSWAFLAQTQTDHQAKLIDSLTGLKKGGQPYIELLTKLSITYWRTNPAVQDSLGQIALELSKKAQWTLGECKAMYQLSLAQWMLGNYDHAYDYASQMLKLAERNNWTHQINNAYTALSLITEEQGLLDQSIAYHKLKIPIALEVGDSHGLAQIYNNMGSVYYRMDSLEKTVELFKYALNIREKISHVYGIRESKNNIAYVLNKMGRTEEALPLVQEAMDGARLAGDSNAIIIYSGTLADIYTKKKMLDSAEYLYINALELAERLGISKRIIEYNKLLSDYYERIADFEKSRYYLEKHWILKDSIENNSTTERIAELELQYESVKKANEINRLQLQNRKKKSWLYLLSLIGLATLGFALFLLQFSKYRQRKNKEVLALQQSETQKLEALNEMKSKFLANISHEFRTPLTMILGPVQQLLAQKNSDKQKLNWIQNNARQLQRLINQLLDLSKLESGKMDLRVSHVEMVSFCKYVYGCFESLSQDKNLDFQFENEKEEIYAYINPMQMEQVLNNLLSNAFKFTEEGAIVFSISEKEKNNKPYVQITIADTGIGMHKDQLPFIFDRFYQAASDAYTGTGIGLSLSKEIVELHHGKIEVTSDPNGGSLFSIWLRKGNEHLKAEEMLATSWQQPLEATLVNDLNEEKNTLVTEDLPIILVVDDNRDLRDYLRKQLESNFTTILASNGEDGWNECIKELPDLIISDVMMPVMDGYEFCRKVKEDPRTDHIPFIMLTARAEESDKLRGLESMADDYLQKPFNHLELRIRIQNLIALRKRLQSRYAKQVFHKPLELSSQSKEEVFLNRLIQAIEQNIDNTQLDVSLLAKHLHLSKSQLTRKLKAIVNKTPNNFIRSFRLNRAKQLLQQTDQNVTQVAYAVGFNSPTYFSKCYSDAFGYAPSEEPKTTLDSRNA